MKRRNFFKNILLAGASFAILPPVKVGESRIWRVERKPDLVQERTGCIWSHYYLSWNETVPASIGKPNVMGEVKVDGSALYYGTAVGFVRLKQLTRPLNWTPRMWISTSRLGTMDHNVQLNNVFARDVVDDSSERGFIWDVDKKDEETPIPEYNNCPV